MTEADTCREFVTPKLVAAGWGTSESVIGEQHAIREANAALLPATLERIFHTEATA